VVVAVPSKRVLLASLFGLFLLSASQICADERDLDTKARLSASSESVTASGTLKSVQLPALKLAGGSTLTVLAPPQWAPLARKVGGFIENTHEYFTKIFGDIPSFKTSVRLMDEDSFYVTTGAPKWTNALFYRGQIMIPLNDKPEDLDDTFRSIRHEYTHAVIHALTNGKCPGWLDEGLAQWAEGQENPALRPALLEWLHGQPPVPLALLQNGFTRLDSKMVPAAYAQSLFAANAVINTYGFEAIRRYFAGLKSGAGKGDAFQKGFDLNEDVFEIRLDTTLRHWARR